MRCPGVIPAKGMLTMESNIVHAYAPLHELGGDNEYEHHLTRLMELFTETVASRHHHNLQQRAADSNISLLVPEGQPNAYPNIFPTLLEPGSARFLFTLVPREQVANEEETSFTDSNNSDFWAEAGNLDAVCKPVGNVKAATPVKPATSKPEQHTVVNAAGVTGTRMGHNKQSDTVHLQAIISIGPRTDAVLDELRIDDEVIPHLRLLIHSTRSSRWVSKLQQRGWGLKQADAIRLVDAILTDVGTPVVITTSVCPLTCSQIFFVNLILVIFSRALQPDLPCFSRSFPHHSCLPSF
jgi:hypothetical protein